MYNETKATTLQANTQIDNQIAVSMYALKSSKGDVNMNITIQNEALYQANKNECDANIETFKSHVEEL